MRAKIGMALVGVVVMAVVAGIVWAQSVPQLINYQGRLTNAAGQPLADGSTVDLTFAFYGAATGGTAYLTVLQEDVVVNSGIYNVLIGSGTITPGTESSLAAVFQKHAEVWMGVKVDADAEMTPRARITSVPYSMKVDSRWWTDFFNKSDYDGDGFSKVIDGATATTDCDDGNAAVNPGASEICDDGIDNDCDGKIDGADNDAPEVCDDTIDNDCDGLIDANDPDCQGGGTGGPMALIPAGCFDMGDAFSEGDSNELPVHNVCITSDFYMDVHEVTNAEYAACVSGGGCTVPGSFDSYTRSPYYGNPTYDNYPVIYVDWNQATAYCTWAGKRLPTEAEWEYAARGGLSGKRFPWGDTISCANANYCAYPSGYSYDTNGSDGYCIGDTSQVESYAANGYGLYDMAGNVWEWTNDWYQSDYYSSSPTNDPPGPASGMFRVLRGGNWFYNPHYLRVADRYALTPTTLHHYIGFRCAGD